MTRRPWILLAAVLLLAAAGSAFSQGWPKRSSTDYSNEATPVLQASHWTINHISAALHLANRTVGSAVAVRCVDPTGTAFESCGGGGPGGSGDALNVFHQSTIRHISSVTHVTGSLYLTSQAGTAVTVTGTALDVNCTGCAAASVVNVGHVSALLHVAVVDLPRGAHLAVSQSGAWTLQAVHQGGAWTVAATQSGIWNVASSQSGSFTVQAAHQGGQWTIAHISSALHIAGVVSVSCLNCSGGASDALNVFHQSTIRHISSVTHVALVDWPRGVHVGSAQSGTWNVTAHQGGAWSVSAAQSGAWSLIAHQGGAWSVSASQSGAWMIQAAHQGGEWNLRHVSSVLHVAGYGTFQVTFHASASASVAQSGAFTIQAAHQGGQWNVAHVGAVLHVAGYGTFQVNFHAGASSSVAQSGAWTIQAAHQGGAWNVSAAQSGAFTVQAAHQAGQWNVAHNGGILHLAVALKPGSNHLLVEIVGQHLSGAVHVSSLSNIGSGNAGTGTTSMSCHSTLALHITGTLYNTGGSSAIGGLRSVQILHLTSSNGGINQASWRFFICGYQLWGNVWSEEPTSNANGISRASNPDNTVIHKAATWSLVEGSGTDCATNPRAILGSGSVNSIPVPNFHSGASLQIFSPFPIFSSAVTGNNLCIYHTMKGAQYMTGVIFYRAGP